MRKILIGFAFAAVLAMGLSPPAGAEPDGNRAIEAEPVILAELNDEVAPPTALRPIGGKRDQAAIAQTDPTDKLRPKGGAVDSTIAVAAAGTDPPWAFAHSAPAPCKDIKFKYILDGAHHGSSGGMPCDKI